MPASVFYFSTDIYVDHSIGEESLRCFSMFCPELRIQIRIRIRILRNKYADPRIWIQRVKYQPNTEKKLVYS